MYMIGHDDISMHTQSFVFPTVLKTVDNYIAIFSTSKNINSSNGGDSSEIKTKGISGPIRFKHERRVFEQQK